MLWLAIRRLHALSRIVVLAGLVVAASLPLISSPDSQFIQASEVIVQSWTTRIAATSLLLTALWIAFGREATVLSQTQSVPSAPEKVQVVSTLLATGIQQIVVVDSNARAMAVYHVEPILGKIQLKSVRRLIWDLQMEQFNAEAPLPSELREVQP